MEASVCWYVGESNQKPLVLLGWRLGELRNHPQYPRKTKAGPRPGAVECNQIAAWKRATSTALRGGKRPMVLHLCYRGVCLFVDQGSFPNSRCAGGDTFTCFDALVRVCFW